MASSNDNVSMALFCDFENVALGVRDANYEKFDIKPVLERLLLKGSIVVKKAYCDWDRYKGFKAPMHEANFELIEIPHVRQSGKNSADIRMVVDALDLCYTKAHVNTFVIISGDSDFSPLVSKLRENNKKVIGVGVKQSTSDLLVANCDEFIFYDDLVRESRRAAAKRDTREGQPAVKRTPEEEKRRREEMDKRRREAVDMAVETFDALVSERGDSGKIWASVLKEAIKRRKPDFSESYYGFRTFGNLLEEAKARGLLEFGRDEKSGAYVYRSSGAGMGEQGAAGEGSAPVAAPGAGESGEVRQDGRPDGRQEGRHEGRRGRGRGRNRGGDRYASQEPVSEEVSAELQLAQDENAYAEAEAVHAADDAPYVHPAVDAEGGEAADTVEQPAGGEQGSDVVDDRDEEERALDEAAAAIANGTRNARAAQQQAGQGKRKPPKIPARQAKAAKVKASQAASGGDSRGKPAAQHAAPAGRQPAAPAVVPAPVQPLAEVVQDSVAAEAPVAVQPAVQPATKGRARAPAKGRAKAGEPRLTAAAAEAAVVEAPAAAPAQEAAVAAEAAPARAGGRRGAASAKPARPAKAAKAAETIAEPAAPAAEQGDAADASGDAKPARSPRRPRKPAAK
ncbi:NYN domain-containing protein [Pseudoduganella aquatica]|uniref:NYN domain-containing protein n=1 Tax=Pseudoduganella aquatica TaxID=2660641 RepID=A0A7X4H9Z3_9BURK|nr:NYN domain-containing protein [Pseudoduganella aquatica]MYN06998.1 NYN domain-containing protein [Pseudoduganella aquatica]